MRPSVPHPDPAVVAERVGAVATAPLHVVAARLHEVIGEVLPHRALAVFTEDCTGRPQKKAGDPAITERVTIAELDAVRRLVAGGNQPTSAVIAGTEREVRVYDAPTGAVLVLCEPGDLAYRGAGDYVRAVWVTAATRIRQQVAEARPDYLRESRAASTERLRVTAELTARHETDLETLLATLRGRDLDDSRARALATDTAAVALVRVREGSDLVASLAEEPVSQAFGRLRADLRPLSRYGGVEVQFVEPPADGRALPGEVAHAARAVVRSAVLLMREQEDVTRIRVQWDCDGTNLLVSVRDDGPGLLDQGRPALRQLATRATALGGSLAVEAVETWGSEIDVRIPLDPPDTSDTAVHLWDLGARETEVLRLLVAGRRNRQIAADLGISENTVKFHTSQVYRKLGVTSRAAAAALAADAGLGFSDHPVPHAAPGR
ncbi:LuxR C-terminal-related transcriptional regulator [Streptomyces sp. NBC_00059]|uniref:LuxR C-terminal-related transcriptional regulator n=1 Tax=Streptomyces sp. NBC_00059 TaxID=2975635 RepID=UPI0022511A7C|nr:LuxR C-terminal-related transcriptional regulator [Streptomyces sp. NBC_00059]MCX5414867.1 LuxR C-terminal-related transcriptional regulator [Streptomyces sp. NBC_00059]